ncbi:hypothetical protein QAD02_000832 [Eretmocerus hayati]|uniref:Uncharacterized protein n=1 Tax=Eretmocerus hayati TaxID=131215 RepID=A0ACC2NFL6_9HYME|nr:hypothetical protein QAD02_000832 [Eretmocerus hayati]
MPDLKHLILELIVLCVLTKTHAHELSLSKYLDLHSEDLHPISFTLFETTVELVMCKSANVSQGTCYLTKIENPNVSYGIQCTLPEEISISRVIKPRIFTFGKNESIIAWTTKNQGNRSIVLKFLIIEWPNCVKTTYQIFLPDNDLSPKIVLNHLLILSRKNLYEVIYENRLVCKSACSETFDNKGKKLAGAMDLNAKGQKFGDFIFNSRPRYEFRARRCFVLVSEERTDISVFSPKEISRKLNFETSRQTTRFSISTTNRLLSFCKQNSFENKFLNCTQGNLRHWFNLTFDYAPEDFMIHNLPDGGLMTVTTKKSVIFGKNSIKFMMTVFDVEKKKVYSVELAKADCGARPQDVYVHIYQDIDKSENCVSIFLPVKSLSLFVDCYSKKLRTGAKVWKEVDNFPPYQFDNDLNTNFGNISAYLIHD